MATMMMSIFGGASEFAPPVADIGAIRAEFERLGHRTEGSLVTDLGQTGTEPLPAAKSGHVTEIPTSDLSLIVKTAIDLAMRDHAARLQDAESKLVELESRLSGAFESLNRAERRAEEATAMADGLKGKVLDLEAIIAAKEEQLQNRADEVSDSIKRLEELEESAAKSAREAKDAVAETHRAADPPVQDSPQVIAANEVVARAQTTLASLQAAMDRAGGILPSRTPEGGAGVVRPPTSTRPPPRVNPDDPPRILTSVGAIETPIDRKKRLARQQAGLE